MAARFLKQGIVWGMFILSLEIGIIYAILVRLCIQSFTGDDILKIVLSIVLCIGMLTATVAFYDVYKSYLRIGRR